MTNLFPNKQVIKFVLGDWSEDGHSKHETYFASSNKPLAMVEQAYKKAIKKVGMDIANVCEEFEDSSIHAEPLKKLKEAGLNPDEFFEELDDGTACLEPESYMNVLIWFIKQGDESLELEIIDTDFPTFNPERKGFGYGLFGL